MGKATGVFLILAGVSTAALILPAVDKDAERQLADVVRIATGAAPQTSSGSIKAAPASPSAATVAPAVKVGAIAAPVIAPPADTSPRGQTPARFAQAEVAAAAPEPSAPRLISPPVQVITRNSPSAPVRAVDSQARATLAKDIQRELKRVGCYDGEVSGEWTPNTRRAMKTFIERVNAALPIDEPDHILRTMVQGHPGNACGKSCPSGQALAADGRCLPAAILAQQTAPKSPVRRLESAPRDTAVAAADAARNVAQVRPVVPKPAWETNVVAAAPSVPNAMTSEGRMAMGGPVAAPTADPGNQALSVTRPKPALATTGVYAVPGAIAALNAGGPAQNLPAADVAAAPLAPSPVAKAERPRPQLAAVRRYQDQAPAFKYPMPSFLGVGQQNTASQYQKSERTAFGVRIFERLQRDGIR